MQRHNNALLESFIAKSMLEEIISNPLIKSLLAKIGKKLRANILPSAMGLVKANDNFENLNQSMKDVIYAWSIKHSKEDAFIGALLPQYTQRELMDTPSGRLLLVEAIYKNLSSDNIKNIKAIHEVISIIKTLDDVAYYYVSDAMEKSDLAEYEIIKNIIFPTVDELDMRSQRVEAMQAITYGISTELDNDLIFKKKTIEGCFSGKAKYFVPSTEERFDLFINKLDAASFSKDEKIRNTLIEKLNHYGIPLNKIEREPISFYAKQHIPWFEKLASGGTSENRLPLIAGLSSSTARVAITLMHLGTFNKKDNLFDLDKAQIVMNCLMGYFVFCGHHSFLEVIEIWNRLIDYVAIYHREQLPENFFPRIPSDKLYVNDPYVERRLPYARIGGYRSFINTAYAESIMEKTKSYLNEVETSVAALGMFGNNHKKRICSVMDNGQVSNTNISTIKFSK